MGNMQQESGFRTNNVEDRSGIQDEVYTANVDNGSYTRKDFMYDGGKAYGYGLCQWTYVNEARTAGRKFDLFDFWQQTGGHLDDIDMQIDFVLFELMNGYRNVRAQLEGCTDLWTATDIICRQYEQPAQNNVQTRFSYAQQIRDAIDLDAWQQEEKPAEPENGGQSMTKDAAIKRVLTIARNEIGYREKNSAAGLDDPTANAGTGNWTKYARDLDRIPNFYNTAKQGAMWCDVFVDWCFVAAFGPDVGRKMIFQPLGSAGAGCSFSLSYYQQAGHFHPGNPAPGDQIFYTYAQGEVSHTGIVEKVDGGSVTAIEGNTSDGVGRRSYSLGDGRIAGFGTPDWSLVSSVPDSGTGSQKPAEDTNAPGKSCSVDLPELRQGDEGIPVERLQTLLIGRGYYCGGRSYGGREQPDGEFGPATEVAVKDLQLAAGIKQDGEVGADTWAALIKT